MLLLMFLLFRRDYLGRVVFHSFLSIVLQIYPIQSLGVILPFGRAIVVWGSVVSRMALRCSPTCVDSIGPMAR